MQVNRYWNNALLVGSLRFPIAFAVFKPLLWKKKKEAKEKAQSLVYKAFVLSFFFVF